MRAIVFDKRARFVTNRAAPAAGRGEALIRVLLAGVCSTDIEITRGYMGFKGILGHEFTGVVERCQDTSLVGKRVVGEINIGCGRCRYCREGRRNHCGGRKVMGILNKDGAFADYLTLPAANLHKLPDSVDDEEAVFAEPLAAAFEILEQVKISRDMSACVVGDGRLGLLVAQVISQAGCSLTVIGRHREKLSILRRLGIRTVIGTDGLRRGFDVVVDATGSPSGLEDAMRLVRPEGVIVLKTTVAGRRGVDLNRLVIDEIRVVGSRCGPFAPAIEALSKGRVDVRPLISKVLPLEEGVGALDYAKEKGVLKVLLRM